MEKIKLAYNWIGPKGPIWNTELPNVLSLAGVAEGINQVESRKYWPDAAQNMFWCEKHNYDVYPVSSLDHDDNRPFIIPFGLAWRVPFEHYFNGLEGILEYSHVPLKAVCLVRNNNGYILIEHTIEAFMSSGHLDVLHGYFRNNHSLPLYKVIYLTGCINAQELYDAYCEQRNIPNDKENRLSIITYPVSFTSFVNQSTHHPKPEYDTEIVPEKLFLMWNRRTRQHRIELAMGLEHHNLIDRSLISFSEVDVDVPSRNTVDSIQSAHFINNFGMTQETVDRFSNRLPLVLDDEKDFLQMCQDYGNKSRPFYQRSLVSIVTETNFYDSSVSLTEKSFKSAKEMHPFIIAGVSGALKGMHELGFKTFGEFWDESYDDIKDHTQRMRKIIDLLADIGSWSPEKIIDFRRKVKPILEHNHTIIKGAGPHKSVEKITNIIRSNTND